MAAAILSAASDRLNFAPLVQAASTHRCRPGILVVDDEEPIRHLLKVALERQGFAVWLAADGSEAVDLYAQERPAIDLVLMDVRMPRMNGLLTLAALQRFDPSVRCCFMSAHAGEYTEKELLLRGAIRVFGKPFRIGELGACLWQLLGKCERRGA